jgi:hypothetical protein
MMSSPYEAPSGLPDPPSGPFMQPIGYGPPQPHPNPPQRPGHRSTLGLASAILLAIAALIVGIVGLNRPATTTPTTSGPSSVASPSTSAASKTSDTTAADRKLCEAVGPLLHESDETGKAFVNLGHTGTPERDAGIANYEASVLDWVNRIQPVIDSHPSADPYLRRMLQRMVDDIHSYATSVRPGAAADSDTAAWNDASVAYGGPFDVCHRLGVQW